MSDEERVVNAQTGGEKGRKLARFDLLPWDCLWEVAEHYGRGAEKYAPRNWERGYEWSLAVGALGRHLAQVMIGARDGNLDRTHLAAIVFHALSLMRFEKEFPELNDIWNTSQTPSTPLQLSILKTPTGLNDPPLSAPGHGEAEPEPDVPNYPYGIRDYGAYNLGASGQLAGNISGVRCKCGQVHSTLAEYGEHADLSSQLRRVDDTGSSAISRFSGFHPQGF